MIKSVTLLLGILLYGMISAQINFEKRVEFERGDDYDGEVITPFGDLGVLVSSVATENKDDNQEIKYELYDTGLELKETTTLRISKRMSAAESYSTDNAHYVYYQTPKGEYALVTLDIKSMETQKVDGKLPSKTFIGSMAVIGDFAFFTARVKKERFMFSINTKTGAQKIIPIKVSGYTSKQVGIRNFQVLEKTGEIFVYLNCALKKESETYVMVLDQSGSVKNSFQLTSDIDKSFVSITASNLGSGKYIYTGTYAERNKSTSIGIFFCKAKEGDVEFIEYYNYLDLKDFLAYLPEKRQEKIEKKKAKKEQNNKEFNLEYYIAQHDVIPVEDDYLFLGEAYYPTYRTETYTSYVNGKPVTRTRRVFDGYQYTHAVLVRFDKKGKLQWNRTFAMWPSYKPYSVKRFISMSELKGNSIDMVFSSYGTIQSMSIGYDNDVKHEKSYDIIETGASEEAKVRSGISNVNHWYGNYFLATGFQIIKDKEESKGKRKRKVIYMNKLSYK